MLKEMNNTIEQIYAIWFIPYLIKLLDIINNLSLIDKNNILIEFKQDIIIDFYQIEGSEFISIYNSLINSVSYFPSLNEFIYIINNGNIYKYILKIPTLKNYNTFIFPTLAYDIYSSVISFVDKFIDKFNNLIINNQNIINENNKIELKINPILHLISVMGNCLYNLGIPKKNILDINKLLNGKKLINKTIQKIDIDIENIYLVPVYSNSFIQLNYNIIDAIQESKKNIDNLNFLYKNCDFSNNYAIKINIINDEIDSTLYYINDEQKKINIEDFFNLINNLCIIYSFIIKIVE
jgi:hypothetical protein